MADQSRQAFLEDLWKRNVPDKTQRLELRNGQNMVTKRVFQKKSAPRAILTCDQCKHPKFVCRKHQFSLFGHDGVRRYVDAWYHHRQPEPRLSDVMASLNLQSDEADDLERQETADRVDVMDEYFAKSRELFNQFRLRRGELFYRDTGIQLPICCKFPQSNLYRAYRDYHQHA